MIENAKNYIASYLNPLNLDISIQNLLTSLHTFLMVVVVSTRCLSIYIYIYIYIYIQLKLTGQDRKVGAVLSLLFSPNRIPRAKYDVTSHFSNAILSEIQCTFGIGQRKSKLRGKLNLKINRCIRTLFHRRTLQATPGNGLR